MNIFQSTCIHFVCGFLGHNDCKIWQDYRSEPVAVLEKESQVSSFQVDTVVVAVVVVVVVVAVETAAEAVEVGYQIEIAEQRVVHV